MYINIFLFSYCPNLIKKRRYSIYVVAIKIRDKSINSHGKDNMSKNMPPIATTHECICTKYHTVASCLCSFVCNTYCRDIIFFIIYFLIKSIIIKVINNILRICATKWRRFSNHAIYSYRTS